MSGVSMPRKAWRRLRRCASWVDQKIFSTYWGPPPRVKILALLAFHNEMRYLPGFFENVPPQVDGVVALDDGSTDGSGDFVGRQRGVLELLRIPPRNPHLWNESLNRRLLGEAAWRYQPDWLLGLDADERVEREFRKRALGEIVRARRRGFLAYSVVLRELWNAPDTYRADGIWDRKRIARLFKARHDHEFDSRPLHAHWAPPNSRHHGTFPEADLVIYHLHMIHEGDRRARHLRYKALDPDGPWQPTGYDYMLQEDGLLLKKIPRGREYSPLDH